jgi:hypothetical protein
MVVLQVGGERRGRGVERELELVEVLLELREQHVGEVLGQALDERADAFDQDVAHHEAGLHGLTATGMSKRLMNPPVRATSSARSAMRRSPRSQPRR